MKSIIFSAVTATAIAACLATNVRAKSIIALPGTVKTVTVSDTGKMMTKKAGKMKAGKMKKDSMKMAKKMDKMKMAKKDTTHKM